MLNALSDAALAVGGSLELSIVVKATLVAALGLVAIGVSRRARASRRYLVIAATFAVLLALPLAILVAPPVGVPVASAKPAASALVSGAPLGTQANTLAAEAAESPVHPTVSQDSGSAWSVSPIALLRGIWILGAALFLLPMVVIAWQAGGLRRTGLPWLHAGALAERLARAAGLRRRVAVLLHENVDAPMTCGLWRPVILLPRDAQTWSQDDLQRALLHELEHVRRADWLALLAARATCALYWFHPLVWMAWRRLHLEAERACDDAVAVRTDRSAYAEQLVALAGRLTPESARPVLAMAGRGDLSHRVLAVLDEGQARGRAGAIPAGLATVAGVVAIAGISPLRAVSVAPTPAVGLAVTATHRASDPPNLAAAQALLNAQSTAGPGSTRQAGQDGTPETTPLPAFEVASVRHNTSGDTGGGPRGVFGERFVATNSPLQDLILLAYGMSSGSVTTRFLLVGGTESRSICIRNCSSTAEILAARFDVNATAPGGVPQDREQGALMLRRLLMERFNLRARMETREIPVYALTVAREGRLGPQLRPSNDNCLAWSQARRAAAPGDEMPEPRDANGRSWCTSNFDYSRPYVTKRWYAGDLASLVGQIQGGITDRLVVDRTGLSGNFEWELASALRLEDGRLFDAEAPAMEIAITEQLGLRLEPRTAPYEVLVIESVEMPTPN
jgi:uncharacterized protein (TIGR03435 family)